jgi:hypothetical protein
VEREKGEGPGGLAREQTMGEKKKIKNRSEGMGVPTHYPQHEKEFFLWIGKS